MNWIRRHNHERTQRTIEWRGMSTHSIFALISGERHETFCHINRLHINIIISIIIASHHPHPPFSHRKELDRRRGRFSSLMLPENLCRLAGDEWSFVFVQSDYRFSVCDCHITFDMLAHYHVSASARRNSRCDINMDASYAVRCTLYVNAEGTWKRPENLFTQRNSSRAVDCFKEIERKRGSKDHRYWVGMHWECDGTERSNANAFYVKVHLANSHSFHWLNISSTSNTRRWKMSIALYWLSF